MSNSACSMEATDGAAGKEERAGYSSNSAAYDPREMMSLSAPSAPSMASAMASARSASPMMPNAGSMPKSSAWVRRMRAHIPWMVDIQAASTLSASSERPSARRVRLTRALISAAAFSVNVMASTSSIPFAAGPLSGKRA